MNDLQVVEMIYKENSGPGIYLFWFTRPLTSEEADVIGKQEMEKAVRGFANGAERVTVLLPYGKRAMTLTKERHRPRRDYIR